MPKTEKVDYLRKLLAEYSKLTEQNKDRTNDYAEGVKDALSTARLVKRMGA